MFPCLQEMNLLPYMQTDNFHPLIQLSLRSLEVQDILCLLHLRTKLEIHQQADRARSLTQTQFAELVWNR